MTIPCWPDWLDDVWAKSPESLDRHRGESLPQHTWSVLETLACLVRLRPWLPEWLDAPHLWNCLFWAAWLHDFGKAARGFQATLRSEGEWRHRHEVLSLAFLDWISSALSDEEKLWVAAAVVSHHRDAGEIMLLYNDPADPDDDPLASLVAEVSERTLAGIWRWLERCAGSWIETLGLNGCKVKKPVLPEEAAAVAAVGERGHERVRDWLRSCRRWLRELDRSQTRSLVVGTLVLRGQLVSTDHIASAHVGRTLQPVPSDVKKLLGSWGLTLEQLYDHQRDAMHAGGNAVLVAPTGSGKTEAALLWASARGGERHSLPRLFYLLPYQASMNAMYDRLNGECYPGMVGLEHSRSTLALYRRFLEEDPDPRKAERAARANRNLARLHCFPVLALSPYQVLKGPYRLKGYETLLSDSAGAAFVLDEIHAYEPDRLAMILATVKYLREQLDARFFVMSATLPSLVRARLAETLGSYTELRASPELFAKFRRHTLHLLDGDFLSDRWLAELATVARKGRSVLVCCNTVRRARHAYREVSRRVGDSVEVVLLHGRFNGEDRLSKERTVRETSGKNAVSPRPILLVATQVVEVSLDIDLDVIYTDPAPLDALVQRFGRINRRRQKGLAPVYVFTEPDDGMGIYDAQLVRRTLGVLQQHVGCAIDEAAISVWLDEAYDGEIAKIWSSSYESSYKEFEAACLRNLRAFNSDPRLEDEFYRAFDGVEVLPASRENLYKQLIEAGEPLEAAQQLVSLRWSRLVPLLTKGKAARLGKFGPYVVEGEYSSRAGLLLPGEA